MTAEWEDWPDKCTCGGPLKSELSGDCRHVVVRCASLDCCDGWPLVIHKLSPETTKILTEVKPDADPVS